MTFGGTALDRLYVVSIGSKENELDGALLVIDGLDAWACAEPRCSPTAVAARGGFVGARRGLGPALVGQR